jgi:LmbE family N-acetylglucosaminyl deacetylase
MLCYAILCYACRLPGDYEGLGAQRRVELVAACGVLGVAAQDVQVLDWPLLRDGMQEAWPVLEVARAVLARLQRDPPDMVHMYFFTHTHTHLYRYTHIF